MTLYGFPLWSWFALLGIVATLAFLTWEGTTRAVRGVRSGSIRPRAVGDTIYRSKQPHAFWRSVAWCAARAVGCGAILIALGVEAVTHGL